MLGDLPLALHSLRRHPGFTLLAILIIALGIGAATAVFSVTEAVLLRPLPYPEAHRLVDISHRTRGTPRLTVHRLDVVDLRRETAIFVDVAGRGMAVSDLTLRAEGAETFVASYLPVTYNYFSVLGVEASVGRTLVLEDAQGLPESEAEDAPPEPAAAVITHGLWQRALGGDPDIQDRFLQTGYGPIQVVGVLPPEFELLHERETRWVRGTGAEIFLPYPEAWFNSPSDRGGPGNRGILALGRLQPGVTYERAQAAMNVMADRLRAQYPAHENEDLRVEIYPLHQDLASSSRRSLLVVAGGVAFLLLLVCANVANLQLVRGRIRAGEDAVRAALGCGRGRLFAQRIWESLLLAGGGGVAGVALAWGIVRMVQGLAPQTVPLMSRLEMNRFALFFGLGAAVVSTVISGLLPAYQASRLDPARALHRDSRGSSARGRRRLMDSLVVTELALSMVLLSGGAVMMRTLVAMSRADLGFDPEGVVTFDLDVGGDAYRETEARATYYRQLEGELRAIPGVEAVARTNMTPLGEAVGNTTWGWNREVFEQQTERADVIIATAGYLEAMGARLLAGRFFNEAEARDTTLSAIVDAKAARMAWPGEDPIGKRVIFWRSAQEGVVVGVVEPMLMRDFGIESYEAIYLPESALGPGAADAFVVRTRNGTQGIAPAIRRAVRAVDPAFSPYRIRRLSDRVSLSMAPTRFLLFLMGSFAIVALMVAAVGLFSVVAFTVRSRTQEMGIRMALGAEKGRLLTMILSRGALLTLLGVTSGTAAALALARFIRTVAYGVSPTEPITLGVMALVLAALSLLACLVPARWASRVDPVRALGTQ